MFCNVCKKHRILKKFFAGKKCAEMFFFFNLRVRDNAVTKTLYGSCSLHNPEPKQRLKTSLLHYFLFKFIYLIIYSFI